MQDTRFTTVADDTDDLMRVLDIDQLGDVETLLMFLFVRPVEVGAASDDDGGAGSLEVIVHGDDWSIGSINGFPMSMVELARSCASTVDELGPYTRDGGAPDEAPDVLAMSDAELMAALQTALGQVRLFNMMDDGE